MVDLVLAELLEAYEQEICKTPIDINKLPGPRLELERLNNQTEHAGAEPKPESKPQARPQSEE